MWLLSCSQLHKPEPSFKGILPVPLLHKKMSTLLIKRCAASQGNGESFFPANPDRQERRRVSAGRLPPTATRLQVQEPSASGHAHGPFKLWWGFYSSSFKLHKWSRNSQLQYHCE